MLKSGDMYYVSMEFTSLFSDMTYEFYESPNRVVIHYRWINFLYYDTKKEAPLREEKDIKSDILRMVPAGERLYYIDGTGTGSRSFLKVMTEDGIYGYIQKKFLGESYYAERESSYVEPEYKQLTMEGKVRLGWHMVTGPAANARLESIVENADGMNVISPTWYRLADEEGTLLSLADKDYVEQAHEMGLQVWALIDDFNKELDTQALFSSTKARTFLIDNMMEEADKYGFDGWNIDFEWMDIDVVGPDYVQFLKELSVRCHQNGLILSVDNLVPEAYNVGYDYVTQGKVVDYVIIMAYDEHGAGSKTAGSVASMGFLKNAINKTLAKVPRERIVMGIPFYTRLWTEKETEGEIKVTSGVLNMRGSKDWLENNGLTAKWDATAGQNYAEYKSGDETYKVWIEDVDSVHERMKAIAGANLAGVAAWQLGQETEEVWPIIETYMHE